MITLPEATSQVQRLRDNYRMTPGAYEELVRQAQRARSIEQLAQVVDGWFDDPEHVEAPKPGQLRALLLGPSIGAFREPDRTRCQRCGDSGWEPRYVLRTARTGGAGYEVQSITEDEYKDLSRKVDWQKQSVYSGVRRCSCGQAPPEPVAEPQDEPLTGLRRPTREDFA